MDDAAADEAATARPTLVSRLMAGAVLAPQRYVVDDLVLLELPTARVVERVEVVYRVTLEPVDGEPSTVELPMGARPSATGPIRPRLRPVHVDPAGREPPHEAALQQSWEQVEQRGRRWYGG